MALISTNSAGTLLPLTVKKYGLMYFIKMSRNLLGVFSGVDTCDIISYQYNEAALNTIGWFLFGKKS